VVCEPTGLEAVTAHRGLLTAVATFTRESGHSSGVSEERVSAIADLVSWASSLLSEQELIAEQLLNIGRIEGGTKPNMIADHAAARFGLRFQPGVDTEQLLESIAMMTPDHACSSIETRFHAPALQHTDETNRWAEGLGWHVASPVNFWTEAALFARSGVCSFVYGPGDIAQAHAPNEFVPVSDLEQAAAFFAGVFGGLAVQEGAADAVA